MWSPQTGDCDECRPQSDADLFGALLGGKSNFGIVTAMECALFPVTRLYAGSLFYSGEDARDVLLAYREFTKSAPDEISTGVALLNLPPLPHLPPFMQGKLAVSLRISYVGDADKGERLIEPLRRAAPVLLDTVADIPYSQFGTITNDPADPAPAVEHFGLLRELTEETVDAIVAVVGPDSGSRLNIVDIRHLEGAFSRPAAFPNAVGSRDAAFAFFGLTVVPPGHRVADYLDSGRELIDALAPWLTGEPIRHSLARQMSPRVQPAGPTSRRRTRLCKQRRQSTIPTTGSARITTSRRTPTCRHDAPR